MITSEKIPSQMKAVVLEKRGVLRYTTIPIWPLEEYGDSDFVLVKVAACGICGSDYRYFLGENPWAQHTLGRYVENPPNIVLGHEIAGEVVAVLHERNSGLLGKHVAPVAYKACGRCFECRSNQPHLCRNTIHLGHGQGWGKRMYYPGAYAEYVPVWGEGCIEIPDKVALKEGAMLDILGVAVHVARQGTIDPCKPVLVTGVGPAGNGIAQMASILGASNVVATDHADVPLELAKRQHVAHAVDVRGKSSEALLEELKDLAPNGYCSVFDTIGTSESIATGIRTLGKTGTFVETAVRDQAVSLNLMSIGGERRIVTSCNAIVNDFTRAMSWLEAGRLQVRDWLKGISLSECPQEMARATSGAERQAFKLLIEF